MFNSLSMQFFSKQHILAKQIIIVYTVESYRYIHVRFHFEIPEYKSYPPTIRKCTKYTL